MRLRAIVLAACNVTLSLAMLMLMLTPTRAVAQPSPTAVLDRVRVNASRAIDFHAAAFPDTVYVGQQVTYQVAVLLSADARSRLRRDPEFRPPELRGLLSYELGTPRRVPAREYSGRQYEAHVFQRALFGIAPGRLMVPSPQLTYFLSQSSSYFSREERNVVHAESAQLVVMPLPEEGRPTDFSGAVGVLEARARFDATAARVGDPLMLTIRLEGTGNVKLLPRPTVELPWASVVAGSERVQIDSSGALVRGMKEFDFILTPTRPGAVVLPVIRYSYFNPYRAAYEWAESTPADVQVADGSLAASTGNDESTSLPLRSWQVEERRAGYDVPVGWRLGLLGVWGGAVLLAFGAWWRRHRLEHRDEISPVAVVVARVADEQDGSPGAVARDLRRTLLQQLATRLGVPPNALVVRADVERVLRRRGVTRASTREVLSVLDALAAEGFGDSMHRSSDTGSALRSHAEKAAELVAAEAVANGRVRLWRRRGASGGSTGASRTGLLFLALAVGLGAPVAHLIAQPAPASGTDVALVVREATAAYEARRYGAASERFAEVVAQRPRDVDLLVNWGAAAWSAGDTVSAVIAWQRAARLEPISADVQERLALLPPGARGGIAEVPMVPVYPLFTTASVLWVLGAAVLIVAWSRTTVSDRGLMRVSVGGALMLVAAALAVSGWWGSRALDPQGLAVVRRPEAMRVQPASDANTAGGLATGDIVRLAAVQEQWARVEHADGRFGWVPAERLSLLVPNATAR
ncbi:MAG TPA: SH3 domain-containing protein [Gemmatimonas sp.]|uniref:SH3 domain-containing protein n=1 Tax=Gemmatimonas sp. TaxID=1962908 RepID=UPI002EDB7DBD